LSGVVDIRDISILTPHWVANSAGYSVSFVVGKDGQIKKMRCVIGEEFPSKDVSKYAVEIFDGVKQKRDKFYTRVFKKNNYTIPKRKGFKVKGVKVQAGDFKKEYPITSSYFTIPPADIKGQLKITLVWEEDREKSAESAEVSKPLEKSSKSAGMTALVSFIVSNISVVFLILIPFMSWALPFMFIPLAIMIPCAIVASFEFWQDIEISDARNKLSRQEQSFETQLRTMLPDDFNDDIVEFGSDMEPGVVMHYDQVTDKIVVNFFLARHLFFDESGEKPKNKKLFHIFLKHELAHREFANPRNKVRFFIHNNFTWLEEFLVSFGDAFRPLNFKTMPQEASGDELVKNLLKQNSGWLTKFFNRIFPNGLEGLSDKEIEQRFNDFIKANKNVPPEFKILSRYEINRLIYEANRLNTEYLKKEADLQTAKNWIESTFNSIFQDELEHLEYREIEQRFNDFIEANKDKGVIPVAFKRLSKSEINRLLRKYFDTETSFQTAKNWIESTLNSIFPNGLEGLSDKEIEQRFNDFIETNKDKGVIPVAFKRLKTYEIHRLITEYFAPQRTQLQLEIYQAQSQLDKDIFEQTKDSQASLPKPGGLPRELVADTKQAGWDPENLMSIAIDYAKSGKIAESDFDRLILTLERLLEDSVPRYHGERDSEVTRVTDLRFVGDTKYDLTEGNVVDALPNILEFVMIAIKGLVKVPFERVDSLESFLDKEGNSEINPAFVQGDINWLYRAVSLARFSIFLCTATYKGAGSNREEIVESLLNSFKFLEIALERLRVHLPAESIGRESARKDLEETYKYHIQIVEELLDQSTDTNNFQGVTQELLDKMRKFAQRLPKSDYPQQPEESEASIEPTAVQQQEQEKSAESAESTAEAALKIGAELAMSSAALTAANVLSLELIESMKVAMNSFADFERFQLAEIQKAEQIAKANNYSDSSSEEKKELINRLLKVLPSDLAAEFMQHFSNEEIKETGVVMSYNPESDVIRVNYALLRAMFIDESGENIKNIDLFKVFVKHELKHREFAKSNNPLYKSVHAISALEEFFVSMGDIYAWQELRGQQGSLISYNDIFRFILSNAKYISILANITLEEATIIANLADIQEEGDPYSFDINDDKKSLRLVVVDSADGLSNSDALSNAQTWTQNGYSAALIEHLPSEGYLNDRYVMPSYNISFGEMVYEVYIRQVNGVHFIGLKLKSGQDTTQNFAAAVQFFANDINTNARLRQAFGSLSKLKDSNPSYGIEKDLEINNNGVVMIDFIGMQIEPDTIEATQKLYQPEEFSSGLNGTYTVVDMPITNDTLTEVEQDIKASMLHKLDRPEKFYQVDIPDLKLSDSNFIERAVKIKKKEGATTLILNINDLDLNMLSSESMIETLKGFIAIVHSFELTATIQIDASKINEELSRSVLALGFDGISIEAQDIEDVNLLRQILEELTIASRENSISEKNTIHLKNQSVRDSLGDLAGMNVLTITKIDEEIHQAELDANQAREAIELGYERGRRVLEQKISMDAKNIRALLNIITQDSSTISAGEIMQAVENAGINAILQKHIGIILKGVDSNLTGTNTKVLEAIGFVRGLIEAYTISRYLETFSISFEMFNTNDLNEIRALGALLTALLIIDRDNKFFKDNFALRSLFEQANAVFGELSTEDSLSDLKKQIISFANLVVERFEERKSIDDIALDKGNPSQKLYMSLAVVNDLINKISFSNIIDNAKRRALGSTKQQTRSILGAA
jgi:hypothetical protein